VDKKEKALENKSQNDVKDKKEMTDVQEETSRSYEDKTETDVSNPTTNKKDPAKDEIQDNEEEEDSFEVIDL